MTKMENKFHDFCPLGKAVCAGAYVNRTSLCLKNHREEAGKMKEVQSNAGQVLRPGELYHAPWRREARLPSIPTSCEVD